MTAATRSVSPVRAVLLNVASLETARRFYEDALGMECFGGVDEVEAPVRALWGLGSGRVRMASMGLPDEPYGRVELVAWEGCTGQPLRDQHRVFDYGILTINLRTPDIEKALDHLACHGAQIISKPVKYRYQPDIFLYEAMAIGPNQERYTLLQIGEARPPEGHVIGDIAATVGAVVPDSAIARAFYSDVLGLDKAFEIDEPGQLFGALLGVEKDFRMHMTLFTSGNCWTGKIEAIEFSSPSIDLQPAPIQLNWHRTGYCMLSVMSDDPEQLAAVLDKNNYRGEIVAAGVNRPFVGPARALMTIAPGGVAMEVLAGAGEAP